MLKANWPMFACTLAIIATLIACTRWLSNAIQTNTDVGEYSSDLRAIREDLDAIEKQTSSIDKNTDSIDSRLETPQERSEKLRRMIQALPH